MCQQGLTRELTVQYVCLESQCRVYLALGHSCSFNRNKCIPKKNRHSESVPEASRQFSKGSPHQNQLVRKQTLTTTTRKNKQNKEANQKAPPDRERARRRQRPRRSGGRTTQHKQRVPGSNPHKDNSDCPAHTIDKALEATPQYASEAPDHPSVP